MSISIRIAHMSVLIDSLQNQHGRTQLIELAIIMLLSFVIADYGIDFKKPYPQLIIAYFDEPLVRFMSYILVYLVASWSNNVSVLFAICVLFLHIDHINLARQAIF